MKHTDPADARGSGGTGTPVLCWSQCQMVQPLWKAGQQLPRKVPTVQFSRSTPGYLPRGKESLHPIKGVHVRVHRSLAWPTTSTTQLSLTSQVNRYRGCHTSAQRNTPQRYKGTAETCGKINPPPDNYTDGEKTVNEEYTHYEATQTKC